MIFGLWAFCFRWDAFVPLHRLWLGYMSELLGLVTVADAQARSQGQGGTAPATKAAMPMAAGMHAKLVKADFHGSIMTGRLFLVLCRVIVYRWRGMTIQCAGARMLP